MKIKYFLQYFYLFNLIYDVPSNIQQLNLIYEKLLSLIVILITYIFENVYFVFYHTILCSLYSIYFNNIINIFNNINHKNPKVTADKSNVY